MASGQLSRAEALASSGCKHACHVMLYCDTKSELFGMFPFRHIILMQMRFDGLLGFPGGLVDQSKETLEAGLSRELSEELGLAIPVTEEDLVESCFAPITPFHPNPTLMLHFYVKKIEEELIKEVERVAASTAADHGQEVLGMVRVPLYTLRSGGGLAHFLSHAFIGNARSQLVRSLLRLNLVPAAELHKALARSLKTQAQNRDGLREDLALTEAPWRRL